MSGPDVVELGPEDLDEYYDVRVEAFGLPGDDREQYRARSDLVTDAVGFGVRDRGRLVGALRVFPVGQYFGAGPIPTGAVAGVVVRPDARARGIARALVVRALDWMRAAGLAAAALHPASTRVYRSTGFEIAGTAGRARVPTRSLAAIRVGEPRPVVPLDDASDAAMRDAYRAWAPSVPGALDRPEGWWRFLARGRRDSGGFAYGVTDRGRLLGYVSYRQVRAEPWGYRIEIDDLVAADVDTAATLWRFLGGASMQAEVVGLPLPAVAGLLPLLDEQDVRTVVENRWMHRVVDLARFATGRATAAETAPEVTVGITDPWAGGSAGTWRLGAAGGRLTAAGTALAAGEPALTLDVGALSALAVGGTSVDVLAASGRLRGDPDSIAALGRLLAAPAPRISDEF